MAIALRQEPAAIFELASRVEDATGIPAVQVEKDFWVTEVLRGVASHSLESGNSVIFKGGTSLSKAHGLIARFSEDVDLIVVPSGQSRGKDDKTLKKFEEAVNEATGLSGEVERATASKGVKRTVVYRYPTDATLGPLREGVFLELGTRGGALPAEYRPMLSMLAKYAPLAGIDVKFIESAPVELLVLEPVRTLVEKLMIVSHAATLGAPEEQARLARHYYDIWCLLGDESTVASLSGLPIDVLAREVLTFTTAAGLQTSPRSPGGFASSAAFDPTHDHPARRAFDEIVVEQLLWPEAARPTFDECCALVSHHADLL